MQLSTTYKTIEEVSLYNLKLKGKNFRSAILFTLARAIYSREGLRFEDSREYYQVMTLAACIEIAHNASLLQDDIIDKAESRRSVKAAHQIYGPSASVFASDFMISRASRMLTHSFDTVHMSQIFSMIISNLVYGELIQAKRDFKHTQSLLDENLTELIDYPEYFNSYISKTYYKTASMISLGCRGLGLIFDLDIENQQKLFNFGANLGIAF